MFRIRWNKFNACKTEVDGITFHSKKEANRYRELKFLEQSGMIRDLKLQVRFPISVFSEHICTYIADFMYYDSKTDNTCVEDTKGFKTDVYKLKKKLFHACYPNYLFLES